MTKNNNNNGLSATLENYAVSTAPVSPEIRAEATPSLSANQQLITDNLVQLLEVIPQRLRDRLEQEDSLETLLEIVMDLGRLPEARFPNHVLELSEEPITHEELNHVVDRVGTFGKDNRAGIERTLHRISAIRNRQNKVIGLTCRIGRAVYGTIDIIQDVVQSGKKYSHFGKTRARKNNETARSGACALSRIS